MAGRVAGKKVFVTGAAQGLGAGIARAVAAEGGKVALADINFVGAEKLAAELNTAYGSGIAFAFERASPAARAASKKWSWRSSGV
jgi:NAD(P)-dependent dehydrogenase (short-subunit alcohol dehydrogenase family)